METLLSITWENFGEYETRPYMRVRFGVVEVLQRMGSQSSLLAAVNHMLDQLRLCPGDNMSLRDVIPGCMMRIGQDQECYDFIKWCVQFALSKLL